MAISLTDKIAYIPSCESPLSADVAVLKGNKRTYIFDVGNGPSYLGEIRAIPGEKTIIISHFHSDHMGNLADLPEIPCYVGNNTFKYAKRGEIVEKDFYWDDGIHLHLFQLPSSHAKGSLGLEVNEEFVFVGDATGPAIKPDKRVYNAQLLFEEIRVLENLKAQTVIQSHNMEKPEPKDAVIQRLRAIYAKRVGNEPYIEAER